jgi:RNA polymerase sigma-70 factor (ECF subfamily)
MPQFDEKLLESARAGDRKALGELLEKLQPILYGFGMRMCGNPDDAQDVLQETLIAITRGIGNFRGDSSLPTWLYTIARSFCIKKRRRHKGEPAVTEPLESISHVEQRSGDVEESLAVRELKARLDQAIARLDPKQREVLVLRDVEGLSAPEVAEVLGLRIEAVKSRLHRARAALREQVAPLVEERATRSGCPDIVNVLSKHLDGDLSAERCAEMERHVASCPHCDATCQSLRSVLATCSSMRSERVPPEVAEPIRARVRELLSKLAS